MSVSPPPLKRRCLGDKETEPATSPMDTSNKERFCVYSWNINGIQPFAQKLRPQHPFEISYGDIPGLPYSVSKKSTKEGEPDYEAHFCLPTDPHNARGFGRKVYGVCTIIRKSFVAKYQPIVRTVDWDLEGRIQIVEIEEPKMSIWNIYAVNGMTGS
ncbi:unnamed protein product [Aureobasidium mustum]|uniref:Uncharacterized protein n=1 Tax=Aureobasidium mustum TaxID=2773714 RepID=A0A9N8JI50_9PEZI|nr:unnamed protein product [Aureobasidium mustum]